MKASSDPFKTAAIMLGLLMFTGGIFTAADPPVGFWGTLGYGFAYSPTGEYESLYGSLYSGLTYMKDNHSFTLRACGNLGFGSNLDVELLFDLGVLYSWVRARAPFMISAGAGLGYLRVAGNSEEEDIDTIGIPLEVKAFFRPVPVLGVGVCGFGNLNLERSFFGVAFCLQAGFWRD